MEEWGPAVERLQVFVVDYELVWEGVEVEGGMGGRVGFGVCEARMDEVTRGEETGFLCSCFVRLLRSFLPFVLAMSLRQSLSSRRFDSFNVFETCFVRSMLASFLRVESV